MRDLILGGIVIIIIISIEKSIRPWEKFLRKAHRTKSYDNEEEKAIAKKTIIPLIRSGLSTGLFGILLNFVSSPDQSYEIGVLEAIIGILFFTLLWCTFFFIGSFLIIARYKYQYEEKEK